MNVTVWTTILKIFWWNLDFSWNPIISTGIKKRKNWVHITRWLVQLNRKLKHLDCREIFHIFYRHYSYEESCSPPKDPKIGLGVNNFFTFNICISGAMVHEKVFLNEHFQLAIVFVIKMAWTWSKTPGQLNELSLPGVCSWWHTLPLV